MDLSLRVHKILVRLVLKFDLALLDRLFNVCAIFRLVLRLAKNLTLKLWILGFIIFVPEGIGSVSSAGLIS